jgi:hypothetical protein
MEDVNMKSYERLIRSLELDVEENGVTYRQIFSAVGNIEKMEAALSKEPGIFIVPTIRCHCICQGAEKPHIHGLVRDGVVDNSTSKRAFLNKWNHAKNKNKITGKCTTFPTKNVSHLMNRILYILGPDSKNYRVSKNGRGFAKIVKDAHTDIKSPYPVLDRSEITELRNKLIDENPKKLAAYNTWAKKHGYKTRV